VNLPRKASPASYRTRLFAGLAIVVAVLTGAWAWSLWGPFTDVFTAQQEERLAGIARTAAVSLAATAAPLGEYVDEVSQATTLRVTVISEDGTVLEPYVARRFVSLPLVVGKGAETRAKDFLNLLAQYPQVRSQVKAIVYVGERRWNLRLADGVDVRLPEFEVEKALATLTKMDKDSGLFSRDITAIDMRLPDRLTVRLSEAAAKARDELFKDKKPKKAGAA
jgi:hypothetical protein